METTIEVVWLQKAMDDLLNIFEIFEGSIGSQRADEKVTRIIEKTRKLAQFPEMGAIDFQLSNTFVKCRYLLDGNIKIVYSFEKEVKTVLIRGVFDTRSDPSNLFLQ